MPNLLDEFLSLSHQLGRPEAHLAILGEGSVSARIDEHKFLVKASGYRLRDLGGDGVVTVKSRPILQTLDGPDLSFEEARTQLADACIEPPPHLRPSLGTFMHAFLLSLPDVHYTALLHPTSLMSLLCIETAEEIAIQRLFPDEVVLCGPASCFVNYADPGLAIAREVRDAVLQYMDEWGIVPKTLWLRNQGLVCTGRTPQEVECAALMSAKAAQVWLGAIAVGQEVIPLDEGQVERIYTRPDEHYRQRLLWTLESLS
jgi:rhamnose utilization protein RhaD (predicted bifunctional aldolase and dehydrogenase)